MKKLFSIILALMMVTMVYASDIMAGSWQSTTGSVIRIPGGSDNFDLVVTHKDGKKFLLQAHWIQVGSKFEFTNEYGKRVRAYLDPANSNQVVVETVATGSINYWQRVR